VNRCTRYVIVKTRALLVPPLVQPRSLEFPPGVLTVTLADPVAEITAVVRVSCNCVLLITRVLTVVPLISPTEDETNLLPFTVRTKPCCTSASVIVLTEREPMVGAGRALPHAGLRELQAWRSNKASTSALESRKKEGRKKASTRFMPDRTMRRTKCR
jgi:hypothetical protein